MAEDNFSDIGRVEAIARLYEGTSYKPADNNLFETAGPAYIYNHSGLFLEGVDFDLVYFPLKHLGYKCVTAVVGEVYADFGRARGISVRIGVSSKLDFGHIKELWSGIVSSAREHNVSRLSLDLAPSRNGLAISISVVGETSLYVSGLRPEPKSKDLLCVSGSLGGAFLGMKVLERGLRNFDKDRTQPELEKYKMMIGSYLKPEISPDTIPNMEKEEIFPSAGYLVSNGLSDAVKRLVRDTGLGAKVYADRIPFEGNSFEVGKELDIDPVSAAMNGGEDYRLLFAVPIMQLDKFRRDFQTFDIIGHLARPEVGAVLVTPDGAELPIRAQGWNEEE